MHPSISAHASEIEELCRRYGVERLAVFGSAARDDFDAEASDVDFLVEFRGEARRRAFDNYFGLKEGLSAVLGRPVDLVTDRSLRNPYFLAEVEASRQVVYGA